MLLGYSLVSMLPTHAAEETWDGGHSSANAWFANLNWADNTAPKDGDDLIFTGTTRLDHSSYGSLDGAGDFQISSITFDSNAGAFVISDGGGGTIKMQGDISNDSTNLQTMNFAFQLDGGGDRFINATSGDIAIGGVISKDGNNSRLHQIGPGTLTLSGNNTHYATSLGQLNGDEGGRIVVMHNNALGANSFEFEKGGTLELGTSGLNISNAIFAPNWGGATKRIELNQAGSSTGEISGNIDIRFGQGGGFEVETGADDTLTFSGNIYTGAGGGAGITKTGDGKLILSGTNTYGGATTVNAGELQLDGSHTGGIIVNVDGALSGSGSFNGALTLKGELSPGNSPGTLSTGNQTWYDGASLLWEVNNADGTAGANPGWDLLAINGSLTLDQLTAGGFTIDITSLNLLNEAGDAEGFDSEVGVQIFKIATTTTGITGFDANDFTLNDGSFSNDGGSWNWSVYVDGNDLYLSATAAAVPEPSTLGLFSIATIGVLLRRRR